MDHNTVLEKGDTLWFAGGDVVSTGHRSPQPLNCRLDLGNMAATSGYGACSAFHSSSFHSVSKGSNPLYSHMQSPSDGRAGYMLHQLFSTVALWQHSLNVCDAVHHFRGNLQ